MEHDWFRLTGCSVTCYSDYFPEYQLPSEEDIKALKVADLVAFLGHHKVDTKVGLSPR